MLRAAYAAAVGAETAAATLWASRRRVAQQDPGTVTLAIKTFERPDVLRRMLSSVRRVFAGPILVADDGARPFVSDDPGVRVLGLPFDSGVSVGRNVLLDAVTTPFVWMADDDMILLPDFDIARVVAYLERNPEVDLVGGRVINLPHLQRADYLNSDLFAYAGEPRRPRGTIIDGLPVSYKVPNFYVARAEAARGVRYDDRLKRVDHTDFFTTAYGRLLCVYDAGMVCLHAHSYFDPHYLAFRQDTGSDLAYLGHKWGSGGVVGQQDVALDAAQRASFHAAALAVVASDVGVRLGVDVPGDTVSARVSDADRARFVAALGALGWRGGPQRVVSPVWGEATLVTDAALVTPASSDAALPPAGPPVGVRDWVRWSERTAWLDAGDVVLVAALPLGPVYSLARPADVIWEAVGPTGGEVDAIVTEVTGVFDDVPGDAARQIREHLDVLVARGLLERTPPA